MKSKVFLGCLGLVFFFLSVQCVAREVTVYRLQIGAYKTPEEAAERASKVRSVSPEAVVTVESMGERFPNKVRLGYYGTYHEAKQIEKKCKPMLGNAFVRGVTMEKSEAEILGVTVPPNLREMMQKSARPARGMSENELVYNASEVISQAKALNDRAKRAKKMEEAAPYLFEICEASPSSDKADWAHYYLGTHCLQNYYVEQTKKSVNRDKREACLSAALEQFSIVARDYPKSSYAETSTFQIASMRNAMKKTNTDVGTWKWAITGYEDFLKKYPKSEHAGRAKMDIAALKFELAKKKELPLEEAYATMEDIMEASDTLTTYEKGRTQLMMAEIQEIHWKNYAKTLEVIQRMDLSAEQDTKTASSATYLLAEAYRGLGDWNMAVGTFQKLMETYKNTDSFLGFDLHPISLYSMAECLMKMKEWDAAYKTFQMLKEQWPNDIRAKTCDGLMVAADRERRRSR